MDRSIPKLPKNNALIERCNQQVLRASRAALVTAGLPACFWEWAAPHACVMKNLKLLPDGESPYFKTHKEEFDGMRLPFGVRVRFYPSGTKKSTSNLRWDASGQYGVFAGYEMGPGYKWTGKYLVWHIDEFVGVVLARDAHSLEGGLRKPHVTDTIWMAEGPDIFPLKAEYDRINGTLEGRSEARAKYHDDSPLPADHVPADNSGDVAIVEPEAEGASSSSKPVVTGGDVSAGGAGEPGGSKADAEKKKTSLYDLSPAELEELGLVYNSRGQICKLDAAGRKRLVDEYGVINVGKENKTRPAHVHPTEWEKMSAEERRVAKTTPLVACAPMGIYGLTCVNGQPHREIISWSRDAASGDGNVALALGCEPESEPDPYVPLEVDPWDQFDRETCPT